LNFFFGVPSASVPTDSALSDLAFLASVTDFALETLFAGFTFSLSPSSIKSSSSSSSASSSKTSSFSFFLANFLTAAVGFDVTAVAGLFVANSSRVSGNELNISSSESESSITKAVFLFPDPFVGELEFD
jgi:hypothetical protein